jgi:hypothetical protein
MEDLAEVVEQGDVYKADLVDNLVRLLIYKLFTLQVEFARAAESLGKFEKKKAQRLSEAFAQLSETALGEDIYVTLLT